MVMVPALVVAVLGLVAELARSRGRGVSEPRGDYGTRNSMW